jgi:hypothetical protein
MLVNNAQTEGTCVAGKASDHGLQDSDHGLQDSDRGLQDGLSTSGGHYVLNTEQSRSVWDCE